MDNSAAHQVDFRAMRRDDIEAGLRLCRASRWNQTIRDWEMFLKLSPGGCRVAVKDERVIGTVATVRYEDRFSWIGMVLVDPAERGRGVGAMLMREAINELKDMPSIRLDATPAGHQVYRKLDFKDEYSLSRMEAEEISIEIPAIGGNPTRRMTREDLEAVSVVDRRVFGADRGAMLEWMFDGAPEYARIVEFKGDVAGYAFGRHGTNFEHLGPVVARDQQVARELVTDCLGQYAGNRVILDASHHEADWRVWLESIGFREQRQFIRMFYPGNPFPGRPQEQFCILGPEFG